MLIYLTGFPGCGKSSAGKKIAAALSLPFYDLDEMIEQESGKSIPEIFNDSGEAVFRKTEAAVLRKCVSIGKGVIAVGGGTPCFSDNMTWMNRTGVTVYIQMSAASLFRRLQHAKQERPLFRGLQGEELKKEVEKLLSAREPFYKKAQYTVKGESLDVRSLASWIRTRPGFIS